MLICRGSLTIVAAARLLVGQDQGVGGEDEQTPRSFERLTIEHLRRLASLAEADHDRFTRDDGRPEYRERRVAVALAQGAALHFVNGTNGVKDLDVWTFYAAIPGARFPADRRETHTDFGRSDLGRQLYDFDAVQTVAERARLLRWSGYAGRRVDFLMRTLPVAPQSDTDATVEALRDWLAKGARHTGRHKPTPWYLAQKAVVLLEPAHRVGQIVWPPDVQGQHR